MRLNSLSLIFEAAHKKIPYEWYLLSEILLLSSGISVQASNIEMQIHKWNIPISSSSCIHIICLSIYKKTLTYFFSSWLCSKVKDYSWHDSCYADCSENYFCFSRKRCLASWRHFRATSEISNPSRFFFERRFSTFS